jgi:hypothetical protein
VGAEVVAGTDRRKILVPQRDLSAPKSAAA